MLSEGSVEFLTNLLNAVQLSGNDPHLVETAQAMALARTELDDLRAAIRPVEAMPVVDVGWPEQSSMADSAK